MLATKLAAKTRRPAAPVAIQPAPMPPDRIGVLVASHSHPDVQHGGSETASHALFEQLHAKDGLAAWYLGCSRDAAFSRTGQSITQPFRKDDFLYTLGEFDVFRFANRDPGFARDFRVMLRKLRPDVVHFHHYTNLGVEALECVAEVLPAAAIILTLHEFLAICHQQGQMVTRPEGKLCGRSGLVPCSRCFPEMEPADFFLRRTYIQHFFRRVDHFIAPSRFLADRYIEWGLPEHRISVIENVARPAPRIAARLPHRAAPGRTLRVGFFGQISSLKGMETLLDAAAILEAEPGIAFSIHGDHRHQPAAFQKEFLARIDRQGINVTFHGAYANADVGRLMDAVELVLVPSIWWENSPVVIQEALAAGRPVVCSDIGGMAEKVTDGGNGFHFPVGNARALAALLAGLLADPERLGRATVAAAAPTGSGPLSQHIALYRDLVAAKAIPSVQQV